jgi:hypothetical protein
MRIDNITWRTQSMLDREMTKASTILEEKKGSSWR